jgi:hypothetical protein
MIQSTNIFIDEAENMFYGLPARKGFRGIGTFIEQLMLYVLAAGSDTYQLITLYKFIRHSGKYGDGEPFIHSWFGSILLTVSHVDRFQRYITGKGLIGLKTRWKHPQPMLILLPIWLMIRHWSDAWG